MKESGNGVRSEEDIGMFPPCFSFVFGPDCILVFGYIIYSCELYLMNKNLFWDGSKKN